jgi:hypothetical protein
MTALQNIIAQKTKSSRHFYDFRFVISMPQTVANIFHAARLPGWPVPYAR